MAAIVVDGVPSGRAAILFALTCGLCLISVGVSVNGPRGQRLLLLPGTGLAATLLFPPLTATLPILLANGLHASTRPAAASRRLVLLRGYWLFLATVFGGAAFRIHSHGGRPTLADALVAAAFYGAVYVIGRWTDVGQYQDDPVGRQMRSWFRLEALSLAAVAPFALLICAAHARLGLVGFAFSTLMLGAVGLLVHFVFEVVTLREQVRAMEKISAVTLHQSSPRRVVERFLQLSMRLVPCDRARLWLADTSCTGLELTAEQGIGIDDDRVQRGAIPLQNMVRFGEGLIGRVADRQQATIVDEGEVDVPDLQRRFHAALVMPMVSAGETVGVALFERDALHSYSSRDVARVQALASQAAATIANVRMHQDVYTQAVTDALTGLANRRHVQTVLADECRRTQRYSRSLSVVMLDVDGFKAYNDTFGHPQGDVLLRQMADLLRESVRTVDTIGRYGGEEFIIVMPETPKADAFRTAERIRLAVAQAAFPGAPGKDEFLSKTISLGIATYPDDTDDMQTLVSMADQALYRAKRQGRNRTVPAGSQVVEKVGNSSIDRRPARRPG
ncbi:MAG: diguanylate cyclase [Capsulimonadaceae bacterium]